MSGGDPSSILLSRALPGMAACLTVVTNRAYRLRPGARATPLAIEVPVQEEPRFQPSINVHAVPRLVEDAHLTTSGKPLTDVIVRGTAHARRGPVTSLETAVQVGAARKTVRVTGDRRIEVQAGGVLGFTAPEPFTAMPLTWDRAYGGRDLYAEERLDGDPRRRFSHPPELAAASLGQLSYPRNGSGRGYFLDFDRARIHGAPAPNLDDPTDPVTPSRILSERSTDWIDRPVAACYEPIGPFTFPRAAFVVPPAHDEPERPVHELRAGALLVEDLRRAFDLRRPPDARAFNCAPAGLAVCRLEGGERARIEGLHRDHDLLELQLPDDRPRLLVELPGVGQRELKPQLGTVLIEPDEDRLTLTWAGVMEVAMIYPDEVLRGMRWGVVWSRKAEGS
jgi:hypothetical protein